ncbi:MAG: HAD-IA family hydrolase [Bacteroidota bacterium]
MKNFDGIIFDIDGTLAATHDLIFASFNHVTEKYLHKRLTTEEIVALFGPTEDVILKDWMKEHYDTARDDYYNFYEAQHNEMAQIFPGLYDTIELIKSKNIPLGIFTGKGKDSSLITLKAIDLLKYFDLIITGDDVEEHKPSPEGIHKFLDTYKLEPTRVLMIGDAVFDVIAASEAGVKSALVLWDDYSRSKYSNVDADYVFKSVNEFSLFVGDNI